MGSRAPILFFYAAVVFAADSPSAYVGAEVCAKCHRAISAAQAGSNMALTWRRVAPPRVHEVGQTIVFRGLPPRPADDKKRSSAPPVEFEAALPGRERVTLPIEASVGGRRHGVSFLGRLKEIDGLPLARPALIETRYLESHTGGLVLSPGFPEEAPQTLDAALGRVLSPSFETKCLSCHGSPARSPTGRAGVRCENCHGPGLPHLESIGQGKPGGILNPGKVSHEKVLEVCGQCHSGFSDLVDPSPHDILISNQVTALRNSECYRQSGGAFSCTTCHDPHRNARTGDPAFNRMCNGCHGAAAKKAAPCARAPGGDCVACHMPAVQRGSFRLVDHWIRVQSPNGGPPPRRSAFLKIIAVNTRAAAEAIEAELRGGASFFNLARQRSVDPSAGAGGFLGSVEVTTLEPALARAVSVLTPGAITPVIESRGKFLILARPPRDFRWRAIALEQAASALKAKGRVRDAIAKLEEALKLNPLSARALVLLGVACGEAGEGARAIAVLEHAAALNPRDPAAHYNLGIAYGAAGRAGDEIGAYRRAIEIEPDLVPAYLNLAAALLSAGRVEEAAAACERGLVVNPLSANLYYNLAQAREAQGRAAEARRAFALAGAIDPRLRGEQTNR